MSGPNFSARKFAPTIVLAVSFVAPACAATPTIPAQFTGTWSPSGACGTAYSDGVSIDASEVMFGESGLLSKM